MLSEHFYRFCRKFSFEAIYPTLSSPYPEEI